ncbi:MAG: ATP-binding protein, partial [Bacteroidales bacterium]|nr:ATP-binding protein [Bacteroidales bacterium]
RIAIADLLRWKESHRRKPLIVEGARQVGKTWLVKEFGRKYYKAVAYVNFEESVFLRNLFEVDYDINRITTAISAATHINCTEEGVLIFLDEIQEAKHGITALKYFYENAPQLHVVVAGSLLGIELHKQVSFPVGKVQFYKLAPMSFREFLMAMGEEGLTHMLKNNDWANIMVFSPRLIELLKQYYYVGGMPEAVLSFSLYHDWQEVRQIQQEILNSYERDFSKHAPADIAPRIRDLWLSLPSQLSKENRKFIYGLVKEGARAREYEIALQWLIDGGLIHRIYAVKAPRLPLRSYEDRSAFKIYCLDVGLLGAMAGLDSVTVINGNAIFTEFKGAMTEQYVLQQLVLHHELFYFSKPKSTQEVDFLLQQDEQVIPIEVKAETNVKAKSLRQFVIENNAKLAYRISMNAYSQEEWLVNIPLYALPF